MCPSRFASVRQRRRRCAAVAGSTRIASRRQGTRAVAPSVTGRSTRSPGAREQIADGLPRPLPDKDERPGGEAREDEGALRDERREEGRAEVAEIGQSQGTARQHGRGARRRAVARASVGEGQPIEGAGRELPAQMDLEGGAGMGRHPPAAARPKGGERVGQGDRCGIPEVDAAKARQDRHRDGIGGDGGAHRGFEDAARAVRRLRGEALIEPLAGKRRRAGGGGPGQGGEGGVGVAEPAEDEGLDEGGAGRGARAPDEAALAGRPIGDGGQQGLPGGGTVGDTDHRTLLDTCGCFDTTSMCDERSLV